MKTLPLMYLELLLPLELRIKRPPPLDLIAHVVVVVVVFRAPPDKAKHLHIVFFTESHQLRDTAKLIFLSHAQSLENQEICHSQIKAQILLLFEKVIKDELPHKVGVQGVVNDFSPAKLKREREQNERDKSSSIITTSKKI